VKAETDRHWNEWGARDPYFSVLGVDRFRSTTISRHRAEFFATGEATIAETLVRLDKAFGPGRLGAALDFGCGVGRLTLPLARRFERVVAVDVAETMRAEAARNLAEAGLGNVALQAAVAPLMAGAERFDLVISYIVLQHIPVRPGMAILRDLVALLAPGGRFSLHLSLRRFDSPAQRLAYWLRNSVAPARWLLNLRRGDAWDMPPVQMNQYDLPEVLRLFSDAGITELQMKTEFHDRTLTVSLLGRRPEA
jgi:SAM-dependent methyltransferase